MLEDDLKLIAANFFDLEIPKEKRYLLKYFVGKLQVTFLRYYMIFGNYRNFCEHTGFKCSSNLKFRLEKRFLGLTQLYENCKKNLTEDSIKTINLIESGKFNLTKLRNKHESK